ncbi:MAG: succinylarginine dihydrolase, partial [Proteobacteria bacterium]
VVSPDDPKHFPARQSREASQAVARLHGLDEAGRIFLKQSAEAIDAGVFHNDVISVVNEDVYLVHEKTFFDGKESLNELKKRSADRGVDIECLVVTDDQVPLTDVIGSYLFNSQLLTLPSGAMVLIAPQECEARPNVKRAIDHLLAQSRRLEGAHYFDLKESMKNGGGPACLRLRLVLSESERAQVAPGVWLTLEMQNKLEQLIKSRYRDRLEVESLRDPQFYIETMRVFDELEQLFGLRLV